MRQIPQTQSSRWPRTSRRLFPSQLLRSGVLHLVFAGLVLVPGWNLSAAPAQDELTLESGDVIRGLILQEDANTIEIEQLPYHNIRTIPTADIAWIERQPAEQRAFHLAVRELRFFHLHPNRERTVAECRRAIAAQEQFLAQYPAAQQRADVEGQLRQWQDELAQVERGRVKYGGQWMSPAQKHDRLQAVQAAREQYKRQQTISYREGRLRSAHSRLADLHRQTNALQAKLAQKQQTRSMLPSPNDRHKLGSASARFVDQEIRSLQSKIAVRRTEITETEAAIQSLEAQVAADQQAAAEAAATRSPRPADWLAAAVAWCRQHWIWLSLGLAAAVYWVNRS